MENKKRVKLNDYRGIEKRDKIFAFIVEFVYIHNYSPTVYEIKDALDISSTSVVDYHLHVLENEKRITRERKIHRSIRIVDEQVAS